MRANDEAGAEREPLPKWRVPEALSKYQVSTSVRQYVGTSVRQYVSKSVSQEATDLLT